MKVCEGEFPVLSCGCNRMTKEIDGSISQHSSSCGRVVKVNLCEHETVMLPLSTVGFVQEFIG